MLKRPITYENFDGETVTETFYFNISKQEIVEWDVDYPGGIQAHLETIIKTEDKRLIVDTLKELVLRAYGERSEDGRYFVKDDDVKKRFTSTAAYQQLFMELAFDAGAAADWIRGVLPHDLVNANADKLQAAEAELKAGMAEALGTAPAPTPPTT